MIETLKQLCTLPGVSSFEDRVRDYLRKRAEPCAQRVQTDALGNLLVWKKGARSGGPRLLICAHMDEVGLMVDRVTDEGYLKFSCVGGIDRRILLGQRVFVGWEQIPGVVGLKAVHLTTAQERKTVPKAEELYIDIGAKDRREAEERVEPGDFASFQEDCLEFGAGMLRAKAIDDRVGCAAALKLLEQPLPMDCVFAFTAQEEVGCQGAFGAAFGLEPELALVLETTTAADLPQVKGQRRVCQVGQGPVLSLVDGSTVYDRELFRLLQRTAEGLQIPWQVKHYIAGGNDARAVQRTKAGVRVAGLSVPVRYLHAPYSVASLEDCRRTLALARGFLDAIAQAYKGE
ncbi:MAG: M42 family metallopeptidase [Oscillospiraceae bacterium]|nr:M42 family metallopeptidase [Oscillospiraceae bacterium]